MLKEAVPPMRQALFNVGKRQAPTIYGHHHCGFRCRNAEETRHFYEDILGLPLSFVVYHDRVPSTGDFRPYCHIFFELGDGSSIGFFDLFDGMATVPDPQTPSWLTHFAFQVDSPEALEVMKKRLEGAGVEVLGPIDHKIFDSIYFYDPNGIRLELVYQTAAPDVMKAKGEQARALLGKIEEMRTYYKNGGTGQGPSVS